MSSTSNDNSAASPASDRTSLPKLIATILTFAVFAGCGSVPFDDPYGGIPPTAQLALSPRGDQLLVSWHDRPSDGSTVVFHAATSSVNGPRAIFIVKNDTNCSPEQINIKGTK